MPVSQFEKKKLNDLSNDAAHSIGVGLKDPQILIFDEISMVETTIFSWIDMRLKSLFDSFLPFGGKSVIVLEDFNQLPLEASTPLYSSKIANDPYVAIFGANLWQELSRCTS